MQNYESSLYRLELCCPGMGAGPESPVIGATSTERLSLSQYGFRIANPFDVVGSVSTFPLPFRPGSGVVTSGYLAGHDVQIVGTIWDSTSYGLWNTVTRDYLTRWLAIAAVRRDTYLRIGLWNGSSLSYYRLYCVLRESNIPFVPYTTMTVATPTLTFFAYDPVIYEDTEVTYELQHTGTYVHLIGATLPGVNRPVFRSQFDWQYGTGVNPTTVLPVWIDCNFSGISLTVDYTLSATGEKIVVDNWNGLVYGGPTTSYVNLIDKMKGYNWAGTGSFWWSGGTQEQFQVRTKTSSNFLWNVRWLKPAANYFVTQTYSA